MNKYSLPKLLLATGLMAVSLTASAIPAKRGLWRNVTLPNGETANVELCGDEFSSYLVDRDGFVYVQNENKTYDKMTFEAYVKDIRKEDVSTQENIRRNARQKVIGIPTDKSIFQGKKKGLVILVEFQDKKFDTENPKRFNANSVKELYQRIINERNFNEAPFRGSVKDYFLDQSKGQFELDFDIVGPYTLAHDCDFYGGDLYRKGLFSSSYTLVSHNVHAGSMVYEAVQAAHNDGVNFAQYDWDNDGEVDQVFVLYAGQGQADGGDDYTIWPHEWTLATAVSAESTYSSSGLYTYYYKDKNGQYQRFEKQNISKPTYDGVTINTYGCANELATNVKSTSRDSDGNTVYEVNGTQINGIGPFCHEFSHCLGFPDTYDTNNQTNYAMGAWDIMCSGAYNGRWNNDNDEWRTEDAGYCPAAYTAFERWCAGWIEPKVLSDPEVIKNVKPLGGVKDNPYDGGDAYVVYCRGNSIEGEYYLLENRQWFNWDAYLEWYGLLIYNVDYSSSIWSQNRVNYSGTGYHPRMAVFQAAGQDDLGILALDAYPYDPEILPKIINETYGTTAEEIIENLNSRFGSYGFKLNSSYNDALTVSTTPKAIYYNGSNNASDFANHEIWQIEQNTNTNRTINFIYRNPDLSAIKGIQNDNDDVIKDYNIYNLNGQKVGDITKRNQLQKGIYIINGKKVVR